MKNQDLGDKKINNAQQPNEGFSGENLPEDYNPAAEKLKQELETDQHGNEHEVARARHTDASESQNDATADFNPGKAGADTADQKVKNAVEHKDFNSDSTATRYPKSHPDNHENRGNMELDE